MDEMWGPVVGCLGFTLLIVGTYVTNKIIKYKLEVARINSETTIKAEEIRCRNQFELDKYINQSANGNINSISSTSTGFSTGTGYDGNEEDLNEKSKSRAKI